MKITQPGELKARELWDKNNKAAKSQKVIFEAVPDQYIEKLQKLGFFILATANAQGHCDCSFKGGGPGFIHFESSKKLIFPDFDGNGLFMSLGNILENPHVAMLFIDFSDGGRLRINGRARIIDEEKNGPNERRIEVEIDQVVLNCAAHVPLLEPKSQGEEK